MDDVADWIKRTRNPMEIRFIKHFHDDPAYIASVAATVTEYWATHGRPDKLLMSFHGLPRRSLDSRRPLLLRMPEDRAPDRRKTSGSQATNT
jgi:ferrochelatase